MRSKMELWDIYDNCFEKTGRTHVRGEELKEGDYHLIVHIFPFNSKGEILIQKRADTVKTKPGMWAATGGSVVAGETAWEGCQRELKEEIGLIATKENTELLAVLRKKNRFRSIWVIKSDVEARQLTLQEEEVADVKWVTADEIRQMVKDGIFWGYDYLEWLFQKVNEKLNER